MHQLLHLVHCNKFQAGVSKLNEAREVVRDLEAEAAKKQVILNEKQNEANKALHLITDTMKSANTQKVQMESLKEQTLLENNKISERLTLASSLLSSLLLA